MNENEVNIIDIVRYIEYICLLGGEYNIGFGLDFDGILEIVVNVLVYWDYENVMNEFCKYYVVFIVEWFLYDNFVEYMSF